MALVFIRIDDRLIHGQITVGWAQALQLDRILLANDAVAGNPSQRDLYMATVPSDIAVSILTLDEAASELRKGTFDEEDTLLILESPGDALALQKMGVDMECVNLGGLHFSTGKRDLLPYVYVSDDEIAVLKTLLARGIELECRDVPTAKKVDVRNLLQEK